MVSKVKSAGVVMPKRTKKDATLSTEAACSGVTSKGAVLDKENLGAFPAALSGSTPWRRGVME